MKDAIRVSVVMPVYNAAEYLKEAIESILSQTYHDFEFLIINDGSVDNSAAIINSYNDSRIKFISFMENRGLAHALNEGINNSIGEYIIRMDADDISTPDRIEKQVVYMDANPEIGVSGTLAKIMEGKVMNKYMPSSRLEASLLLNNVLVHPTVIIRKAILDKHQLRYSGFVEDYRLWVAIARFSKLSVLPEVLLYYRLSKGQFSVRYKPDQREDANKVRVELFEKVLNRPLKDAEQTIVLKSRQDKPLHLNELIIFCREVESKNIRYKKSDLGYVLQKILIRNIYHVNFQFGDALNIIACHYLTIRQRISIFTLFLQKIINT